MDPRRGLPATPGRRARPPGPCCPGPHGSRSPPTRACPSSRSSTTTRTSTSAPPWPTTWGTSPPPARPRAGHPPAVESLGQGHRRSVRPPRTQRPEQPAEGGPAARLRSPRLRPRRTCHPHSTRPGAHRTPRRRHDELLRRSHRDRTRPRDDRHRHHGAERPAAGEGGLRAPRHRRAGPRAAARQGAPAALDRTVEGLPGSYSLALQINGRRFPAVAFTVLDT